MYKCEVGQFSYGQKSFYEKMGVGTEITIRLENIPEGSDYDLAVYDAKGNQIGIANVHSVLSWGRQNLYSHIESRLSEGC